MKKKTRTAIISIIALVVLLIVSSTGFLISKINYKDEYKRYFYPYLKSYFGDNIYEILVKPTTEDSKIAESILDEVDKAMRFIGTTEERKQKFGCLYRYCIDLSYIQHHDINDVSQIEFDITIDHITSNFKGNKGYVWFEYTQILRHSEKTLRGSADCLVRLEVEKNEKGEWEVVGLREPA